jgi:hypothetical protein
MPAAPIEGLTLRQLLDHLTELLTQDDNALEDDPVVVRVDLGPEEDLAVYGVYLEHSHYDDVDPVIGIDT